MSNNAPREMTATERREIRRLVMAKCATYDAEYGCLILGCDCYMFGKRYAGNFCKWFQEAILPSNPSLEAALTRSGVQTKPCKICGHPFPIKGRKAYCSEKCEQTGKRIMTAKRVSRHRNGGGNVTV